MHERAAEVFTFVQGHLAVQEQLDGNPDRQLAEWTALITADIGAACAALDSDANGADTDELQ